MTDDHPLKVGHTNGGDEVPGNNVVQDLLKHAAQLATNRYSALVYF
jgi:hypothetical protein